MHSEFRFNQVKRLELKPTNNDEKDLLLMLMKQGDLEVVFAGSDIADGIIIQPRTKEIFELREPVSG